MKYFIILLFLIINISIVAKANDINGSYSSDHKLMKCEGDWDHPFLPTTGRLSNGIPNGALLSNSSRVVSLLISEDLNSISITKQQMDGNTSSTELKVGYNKNLKVEFKNNRIYLKQNRLVQSNWDHGLYLGTTLNQRFMAVITLTENNDLLLENYSADGASKLVLKNKCVLPRI